MIKVIITDDHQMVVDGLKSILGQFTDYKVITTASNGRELLQKLEILEADIVLLDIDMPVMNGIEALKEMQKRFPKVKTIILSMHDEKSLVKKMSDIGAKGFLFKNSDADVLLTALNRVVNGQEFFEESDSSIVIRNELSGSSMPFDDKKSLLTEREIEIIQLVATGLSNKEIADRLFISPRTVDTHRTNLMRKLEVNNVAGLVRYAIQNGFIN
jgi:DNA-binding NarL/FixJ family response regulator